MTPANPETAVAFLLRADHASNLESLTINARDSAPVSNFEALPGDAKKWVEGAFAKLATPAAMSPPERMALEAIIIPDRRPAIAVANDDYAITHRDWLHLNADPVRARILPAIPAIGRLEVPSRPDIPYGGTAFLVGPNLLMTNRHVADLFVDGVGRNVAFRSGATAKMNFVEEAERTVPERFDITSVVLIHPYWDMALLRVEGLTMQPLALSAEEPAADEDVVVIGFPALNTRLSRAVQDEVFGGIYNVKRLQPGRRLRRRPIDSFGKTVEAATHDASTLGGNSGSAVISVATGRVIALHFGGAYLDTNYAVPASDLALDSQLVDAGIDFGSPRPDPTDGPWARFWSGNESSAGPASSGPSVAVAVPGSSTAASFSVPLTISVSLGAPAEAGGKLGAEGLEKAVEPWHDMDYGSRRGYDPDFLGMPIPLPTASDPSSLAQLADGTTAVPYMHFSVAMHAGRRLALFAASNVRADAAVRRPDPERDYSRDGLGGLGRNDREKWFTDPRLRGLEQLPDRFFEKDRASFDKGHLVRRDDVAWGETFEELRIANGDTYHVTNCTPQVARFNRASGDDNWGDFEKAVLKQAVDQRLTIIAGPVLAEDDPVFTGLDDSGAAQIRIPRGYWKVIVAPDGAGLGCYAFLLEQDLTGVAMERLDFAPKWRRSMLKLSELEARVGLLTFPDILHDADRLGTAAAAAIATASGI